ncbi:MAG: hypothetical protein JNL05_12940 [Flavobacteriales bacterium]|nr:hypothetical protein [Flavobacteriales bacterium]
MFPTIERPTGRNIGGTCELLVVDVAQVVSVPDEVEGNVSSAVTLAVDAAWTTVRLARPGARLQETWKRVDGRLVCECTITGYAAKDQLALLPKLRRTPKARYLVLFKGLDGDMLLLGTKEQGVMASVQERDRGDDNDPQNGYSLAFQLVRSEPVPFYMAPAPSIVPVGCPTLATLIAAETGADIWALLDSTQQAAVLAAAGVVAFDGIIDNGPPYTESLIDN